jgi:hypothetical protein
MLYLQCSALLLFFFFSFFFLDFDFQCKKKKKKKSFSIIVMSAEEEPKKEEERKKTVTNVGTLHVDESWGPTVRLTAPDGSTTKDLGPGRYVLGRHSPFEVDSRACSREQADLLVSSHTIAVTPRGRRAMRLKRAASEDMFVMTPERNYQIFDGDCVWMGETQFFIVFTFLGKLKELEDDLQRRQQEAAAKNKKKGGDDDDDDDDVDDDVADKKKQQAKKTKSVDADEDAKETDKENEKKKDE